MKDLHLLIPEHMLKEIKKAFPNKSMAVGIRTAIEEYLHQRDKPSLESQLTNHLNRLQKKRGQHENH